MRFYSLLTLLILSYSVVFSQTISGKITQGESSRAIDNAIILVTIENGETPLANTKTDSKGNYSLDFNFDKNKNYQVIARFIGYETYKQVVNSNNFPLKLNIPLKSTSTQLQEVEVEGTRARATIKDDTVIYDAKAFKTHKDANVEDLVTKMPGITKEGGEVKAYGEKVQKVLVDGQEFFGEDANIALKNLPAETVDKVEVFDALNDREAFTGFNSGNTTKTMNLKTKAGMNKGNFGKAYAGYGTNDRFQVGGNYNYYNGSQRVSLLGMANNINNLNFSTSEIVGAMTGSSNMGGMGGANMMRGMNFGMRVSSTGRGSGFRGPLSNFTVSNQDGVNDAYSFGLNYNDKWGQNKATNVNLNYFGNRTDNFTNAITSQQNLLNNTNTLQTNQDQVSDGKSFKHRFSSRIDGRLDGKNSYVWTSKLNFSDNNTNETTQLTNSFESSSNNLKNTNSVHSLSNSVDYNTNLLYKLGFDKKGRTFSINSIIDLNSQKGTSVQDIQNELGITTTIFGLDYVTNQWTSTFTNIFTYTEPSGKYGQWLINYSPSLSNRKNDREVSLVDRPTNTSIYADSLSSGFTNNLFYNIGGISYRLQYSKLRLMFGSNVQNISFDGRERFLGNSELKRDFFGVLPYFNIQYNTKPMTKLRLTYNTSMNIPSISQVQPVLDLSNPVSVYQGNQNLSNEYSHNLFFHYMKPNIAKGTFLIFVSNLNYTTDKISNYSYTAVSDTMIDNVNLRKGVTYNKYINMDNAFTGFIFGNYTLPVKPLKSNFSMNGNYTYSQTPSMINLKENTTSTNMFSVGLMLSSNISQDIDFSLGYNPKYLLNSFSLDGLADNNYWVHSLTNTFKLTILKDWVWSSDFSYNYNSQIEPSLNQHIFLLGSSIARKFLKSKQLEAKLTIFDIFNQNQNISRTITNNTIVDNRINAMNRYGMLTLTYNFKKFQGTDPDKRGGGFMQMMMKKED